MLAAQRTVIESFAIRSSSFTSRIGDAVTIASMPERSSAGRRAGHCLVAIGIAGSRRSGSLSRDAIVGPPGAVRRTRTTGFGRTQQRRVAFADCRSGNRGRRSGELLCRRRRATDRSSRPRQPRLPRPPAVSETPMAHTANAPWPPRSPTGRTRARKPPRQTLAGRCPRRPASLTSTHHRRSSSGLRSPAMSRSSTSGISSTSRWHAVALMEQRGHMGSRSPGWSSIVGWSRLGQSLVARHERLAPGVYSGALSSRARCGSAGGQSGRRCASADP